MAHRFVRATPLAGRLGDLYDRIDAGEIEPMEPFGRAMTEALNRARFDEETGEAVWVEEDYCTPPLAMEREAVLDDYFESLDVVEPDVDPANGWARIEELPRLRERVAPEE